MDRVHADLEPDILAADRLRNLADTTAIVLISLVFLRLEFPILGRRSIGTSIGLLIVMPALLLPTLYPESALTGWLVAARDMYYAAFVDGPAPAPIVILAAVVLGVLLWRSSARAFRTLELTDIAPAYGSKVKARGA